jgi:geranylgeranyl diphosphate synthase type I
VDVLGATDVPAAVDARFAERVEARLGEELARRRAEVADLAPQGAALVDEIRRLVEAGGKRLRPLFCRWGYRAALQPPAPEPDGLVRAAAALELLHTFAVIHDDVIDRSRLRRGAPTSPRQLAGDDGSGPDAEHRGRAAALLAGDLCAVLAEALLAGCGLPGDRVLAALEQFDRSRVEAVTGQYLDLLGTGPVTGEAPDEGWARLTASLKSGSYTVVGPLRVGAALGGGSDEVHLVLEAYGRPLGEAFQLRDDVLGTFGDPAATGKDRDGDIREGKRTVLVAAAWRLGSPAERELLARGLARPDLPAVEVEAIRDLFRTTGALAATLALIDGLAATARAALDSPLPEEVAASLDRLAGLVALRDA